jgi:VWFA-related protein
MKPRTSVALLACAGILGAQQPAAQPQGDAIFKSTTQLVVETVNVKDKNGKPVEGLTANDFTVTEDGVPQAIKFFEYQRFEETVDAAPLPPPHAVEPLKKIPHTMIAPESPGSLKYRDRRLLALYFDLSAMPVPDQLRAIDAGRKFIRSQMTRSDLMSIMIYQGSAVQVAQDFTDDRDRLLSILETMIVGEDQDIDTTADASAADTGAAFGQDDAEFNIFNTDRQLSALQTAVNMLGKLNEKKSMIYFASGLRLNGVNNQAQLHATVNAAVRAGVSFFTVDARGLVASAPLGNATQGSPGGLAMYTGASAGAALTNFQRSQDTMWSLASDTGGKALLDYNDLAKGIVQAQQSITSYYIIGYYTSNEALNGKYRRIKITLNNNSASLDYRQGYFAGKVFAKFTASDKERQLEDALMLGDPITELTIAVEVNYFQLNRSEYFIPVAVKIPGSELALARRGGAEHTLIDFIGEIKDEYGSTMSNVRDKIDVKLSGETAAQLAKHPIQYETGFTLLPGKYVIKFLARDAETGRIGTYQGNFIIPNLMKEEKRVPISSVVLSSQKQDISDALYTVKKNAQLSVNPLILENQQLIPSVTRVFSRGREMYVFLQAYERSAATTQPVTQPAMKPIVGFVSFYRGEEKALEIPPVAITDGMDPKSRAVPMRFTVPLDKLQPGEYTCQVTVLDPTSQKAAFWRTPVMIVQ